MKLIQTTSLVLPCIMAAACLSLYSCKDEPSSIPVSSVLKYSYINRTINIDLSDGVDKVHVPVVAVFENAGLDPARAGAVVLDETTAIENIHFAFPETEAATLLTDTTFTFPIKLYPSRITKPITITLLGEGFRLYSRHDYRDQVIDTVTINIIPAKENIPE